MKVYNPATGELLGDYPEDTREDCIEAIRTCRLARKDWATLSPRQRGRHIIKARTEIMRRRDGLAQSISECTGKTRLDAFATEVVPSTVAIGYYAREIRSHMRPKRIKGSSLLFFNKSSRLHQCSWGVVGIISPWNYPFGIPFHEVTMALLAGNGVILKLATQAQPLAEHMKAIFDSCGLPQGLFSILNLPGREAGPAFLEAGVDKLFFTGSVPVGKRLMELAAKTLTPVSLELGGNDAMIVRADANIQRAAEGAVWAGISNSGQSCGGVERVYVHEKIYDSFMAVLKIRIESLRQGPDKGGHMVDVGSLTTQNQLETVKAHIADALSKGARIFAQSPVPDTEGKGLFYPATVLADTDHSMQVMREETFGPVLAVMKVSSDKEALRLANDSNLGLTGSVWSKNTRKAQSLARGIEAGAITLNDHLMSHGMAETPWGGFKESAIGRSHGHPGFCEMTQPKVIIHDCLHRLSRNIWWYPYNTGVYSGLSGAMDTFYGKGAGTRLSGVARIVSLYLSRIFGK